MEKQIFKFEKLRIWDKTTIILYFILTVYVHFNSQKNNFPDYLPTLIFFYALGTHFFNYLFNYKSLRNLSVFFIWILFAIYHLWLYNDLIKIDELNMARIHSANGLKFTIWLLIIQQIIRFVYIKLTSMEIVSPVYGGGKDLFDNRKLNFLDYTFFFIYIFLMVILNLKK